MIFFYLAKAAGTIIVAGVVGSFHAGNLYNITATGRVDELAIADVDTYMGQAGGICTGKEHDITGL